MSHFTVAVVLENPSKETLKEALQPFHEYECTGIKDQYVKFEKADETNEELEKEFKELEVGHSYENIGEFVRMEYGYEKKDGEFGKYTNPNSRWDWWEVGGRWSGLYGKDIIKKSEIKINSLVEKGLEKEIIRFNKYLSIKHKHEYKTFEDCETRTKYWEQPILKEMEEKLKGEDFFSPKPEDFCLGDLEKFKQKVKYETVGTYAIIKDGEWYGKGEMGWFAASSNENKNWETEWFNIFNSIPGNHYIVLVDCHI